MNTVELPNAKAAASKCGSQMHSLMATLYPICRSITGEGVVQTLNLIKKEIPLTINMLPTGTKVFDWDIPREWNIRQAYIKNSKGEKILDFENSNLHVLNCSTPIDKSVTLAELKEHLYTLPEHPDWIPYRTSYYKEDWGFCMSHRQLQQLPEDLYDVFIDSSLKNGYLTYGEYYIPGERPEEVLISTRICHPSMCNDNLSGICVATYLVKELRRRKLRYSYRFLFIPGTIGAIAWLSFNESIIHRIRHGLTVSLLGIGESFTYKRSRRGDTEIDQVVEAVLRATGSRHKVLKFSPYGDDERQFCSPGFNLPMGCLMRTPFEEYPEYHTSADNLELIDPDALDKSLSLLCQVVDVLEANKSFVNVLPKGEVHLGKRGLYHSVGGDPSGRGHQLALLWVLNYSDGHHSLLDISQASGISFETIIQAANELLAHKLLVVRD